MVTGYEIVDTKTQTVVRTYGTGKGEIARRWANKQDTSYGAHRYYVRPVYAA